MTPGKNFHRMLVAGGKTRKCVVPDQTAGVSALPNLCHWTKSFRGNRGTLLDVRILICGWGKFLSNTKHVVDGIGVLKQGPCKCFILQSVLSVLAQNINEHAE